MPAPPAAIQGTQPVRRITRELARYVHTSRYDALPTAVRREGVRAFVNWVGCAAGGSREANVAHVIAVLDEFNGARDSSVVGHRLRLDMLNAAFINTMSSAAVAFNDTHFATVAHPTSPVAGALLALAFRQPMNGIEFLHALILGVEIQCRIGNILFTEPAACNIGLSMAGLVGGIGAAVAAAKAMGLGETGIATALGHAANQAGGLRESHTTMGSQFTPGHTARCGLMSALLAARNFTCSDTMIEGEKGFGVSFASNPNMDVAVENLGKSFEISTLAYKPYPCGFVVHPVIDACLDLARANTFNTEDIARIELTVSPLAAKLADRAELTDRNQTLVSLQHWAAASVICKIAGLAQMDDAVVHDAAVARLRRKVAIASEAKFGAETAAARIVLKNGQSFDTHVEHCRGSIGRPLTDDELAEKTRAQCQLIFSEEKTAQLLDCAWRIEQSANVGTYAASLAL
ncbi:MAG: MmgE/PrpD family protein [Betaproteobacteria bacterium]|nr:MmgE/PrpD family protein [Betaproteobacteria bacterium]